MSTGVPPGNPVFSPHLKPARHPSTSEERRHSDHPIRANVPLVPENASWATDVDDQFVTREAPATL